MTINRRPRLTISSMFTKKVECGTLKNPHTIRRVGREVPGVCGCPLCRSFSSAKFNAGFQRTNSHSAEVPLQIPITIIITSVLPPFDTITRIFSISDNSVFEMSQNSGRVSAQDPKRAKEDPGKKGNGNREINYFLRLSTSKCKP